MICIIIVAPHSPGIEQDSQDLEIELAQAGSLDSAEDSQDLAIEQAQADSQDSAEGKH